MSEYNGAAVGAFEADSYLVCCVAIDAAVKAADVKVEGIERNRLKSGACVKLRGRVSDIKAAMEAAEEAARRLSPITKSVIIPAPSPDTEIMLPYLLHKQESPCQSFLCTFWSWTFSLQIQRSWDAV